MRRCVGGAGCGARGRGSQPRTREASGPRPTGIMTGVQGACWTAGARCSGSQARPEVSAGLRPRTKTPRWSAGRRRAPRRGAHAERRRLETQRLSALRPLTFEGGIKARLAPLNIPGLAKPYPKSRSPKIASARACGQFDINPCGRKTDARTANQWGAYRMHRGSRCGRPRFCSASRWPVAPAATPLRR
jgi:hypothetical protein